MTNDSETGLMELPTCYETSADRHSGSETRSTFHISQSPFARGDLAFPVALLSAAALLVALAWPMLRGQVYVADDLGEFHLPLRLFYAQQLERGEAFDWCPDLYCGFYLTGEGQIGGYHPLHLALYKTLPLWLAFDLECWLSYPLLLAGMYLFLRRWQIAHAAALFGATAFTFGGFNLLHFVHPNAVAVIAHLPWLLLASDILIKSQKPLLRRCAFAAIALLTGSQLLLGYPQYVLFSLLVEGGYAFWIARSNIAMRWAMLYLAGRWMAAVLIGFLIGAIQLLPTIDALQNSVRQSASADFAGQGSLHSLNLLQLVAPYLFATRVVGENTHELGLYVGAVPLALAVFCLMRHRSLQFRTLIIAASITAVAALLWAFGRFGPMGWFQAHVPLLNNFRFPCRAIVIFQLAVAVLATLGMTLLLHQKKSSPRKSAIESMPRKMWLLPIASVIAIISGLIVWPQYLSDWPLTLMGLLLMSMAVWLIHFAARGLRWAVPALIVLSAIDLGVYGLSYSVMDRTDSLANYINSTNVPPALPTTRVSLDITNGNKAAEAQNARRAGDRILFAGWKRVDGYAGLEPSRQLDYCQSAALQVAGVDWMSTGAKSESQAEWIRLPKPQPRAWLVTNASVSTNPASDINRISISDTALVGKPLSLSAGTLGDVQVLVDRPGTLTFAVRCDTQQLLIISESFHRGWHATLDGKDAEVLPANGDFMGVVVLPGNHKVSLNFQPQSLQLGRMVSSFGLGLIVATLLWPVRPGRRKPYNIE